MTNDASRKPVAGIGNAAAGESSGIDSGLPAPVLYRTPMELRWRDLDAFNHVNNSSFLTFLEEARIRWFASLGTDWVTDAIAPLLAAVQINYRQPIPYPSGIVIELSAERVGNTSITLGHRVLRRDLDGREDATLYADGNVVMVWIDRASGRPIALPEVVRSAALQGRPMGARP